MKLTRRKAIVAGGASAISALAGCQVFSSSEDSTVSLQVINYASESQRLNIQVVNPEQDNASDAVVYSVDNLEIPPRDESNEDTEAIVVRRDVADRRPYVVRAQFETVLTDEPVRRERWRHYHYFPRNNGQDTQYIPIELWPSEESDHAVIRFGT